MIATSPEVERALERFERLHPKQIDLSLDRILVVLDALGRPQDRLPPVIHVAGTNGKGSTTAFIRAMAEAAGLRTHVFTSPHLVRFNERIRLAGGLISDARLVDVLDRVYAALDGRALTHFEAVTAAAFTAFAETPADLLVLEVGLGGRFDATNVVDRPAVSAITPVDYDHKAFLGSDLGRIAWEKAGILKPGRPAVSAVQADVAANVISEEAAAVGAPLRTVRRADIAALPAKLGLAGPHQCGNAALAALALQAFGDARITEDAIQTGARDAVWPARLQRLGPGPLTARVAPIEIWLDGGHNPHAARALAEVVTGWEGDTALVCAMMGNKDAAAFFAAFAAASPTVFACPNAQGRAGASPERLAEAAGAAGLVAKPCASLLEALQAASAGRASRILICGSLYLAGDVLAANDEAPD